MLDVATHAINAVGSPATFITALTTIAFIKREINAPPLTAGLGELAPPPTLSAVESIRLHIDTPLAATILPGGSPDVAHLRILFARRQVVTGNETAEAGRWQVAGGGVDIVVAAVDVLFIRIFRLVEQRRR